MSVKSKRKCDYCNEEMEIGGDISRPIKAQNLNRSQLQCSDTGLILNGISVQVVAADNLDICFKCALGYALTEVKKELDSLK